jgi:uncharacterized protein
VYITFGFPKTISLPRSRIACPSTFKTSADISSALATSVTKVRWDTIYGLALFYGSRRNRAPYERMDIGPTSMDDAFRNGIRLFNSTKFFECHEVLEAMWLKEQGEEKVFLHGLIQVAAAFHHYTRRNHAGFRSLLEKGWTKLERFGNIRREIDLAELRAQLQRWRKYMDEQEQKVEPQVSLPLLPHIHWRKNSKRKR